MAILKPYVVKVGNRETVLRLSEETVQRLYPGATPVKVGKEPVTPEDPKEAPAKRAKTTK